MKSYIKGGVFDNLMKVIIYLNHPAHFQLFKVVFKNLETAKVDYLVVSKKKDVLDDLLINHGISYRNVQAEERGNSKLAMINAVINRGIRLFNIVREYRPDLIIGTAFELAHIGKILGIPFISVNEDDANVIPLWSKYSYPYATAILSPFVCDNGKWNDKSLKYPGYHELAYLHPEHFTPSREVVESYFSMDRPYVIMRFARLTAHHDSGISGINKDIASRLVNILKPHANIYITSERKLENEFEPYRLHINPLDIHHVMAFAKIYIGDSQTMAAEAGVLGIPFVRFNDFVGRIGYLSELEDKYKLGFGIKTDRPDQLYSTVKELIETPDLTEVYNERRAVMLNEKINTADFLTWFIQNFPESMATMKSMEEHKYNFTYAK